MNPNLESKRSSTGNTDDNVTRELIEDLSKKSIEELIYIHFNQDDYLLEFTSKQRNINNNLLTEISNLTGFYKII